MNVSELVKVMNTAIYQSICHNFLAHRSRGGMHEAKRLSMNDDVKFVDRITFHVRLPNELNAEKSDLVISFEGKISSS